MKKNKIFQLQIILILSFFVLLFLSNNAQAQTKRALSISPLIFDFSVEPGDSLKNSIRLYNPSEDPVTVTMAVEDFLPTGESGEVQIVDLSPEMEKTYSLINWVKIEPVTLEIYPRQEKFISFTVEVPVDVEPGGKYGAIIANLSSPGSINGPSILQKIASLLLLTVAGEVEEKLLVTKFSGPNFQEYGPINFLLQLENQGTVHLRPRGFVTITDWQNKKVVDLPLPQNAVMPGAKRIINIVWPEKNIIGRYTATLVGSYGSANKPFVASLTFWIWPWKISLVIFIIFVLLLILFIRARKRMGVALRILFRGEKKAEPPVDQSQIEPPDQNLQV